MSSLSRRVFWCICSAVLVLAIFLRLYHVNSNPPSIYWEEAALGYDAYSILKTGHDFHGHAWPLVAFESFGDWKPSLYFYAIVPFMAAVGVNEWAVRLPSVVSGVAIVIGCGYLAQKFLAGRVKARTAQLLGMGVAAISPWAVLFSRIGWEANLATALILWGVISFLWFIERDIDQLDKRFVVKREEKVVARLLIAVVCLCLSMYAYHSARVVAPMVGLGLLGVWWWQVADHTKRLHHRLGYFITQNARFLLIGGGLCLLLLSPLIMSLNDVQTQQRFNETNIFADLSLIQQSNQLQVEAGHTWWARLFYHRYVIYSQAVIKNYLQHFTLDFLFISGDTNVRHSVQFMGQLYHVELILLLLGVWQLLRRKRPLDWFLVWWLVIGIFPAALTKAVPHALRILPTLPVWLVMISSGIVAVYELAETYRRRLIRSWPWMSRRLVIGVITLGLLMVYGLELTMFWRFYSTVYPYQYAAAFNDGDKQMVAAVNELAAHDPALPIAIMRSRGRPSVYYWFYSQTEPQRVQVADSHVAKDQGEFLEFEHVSFPTQISEVRSPAIVAVTVEDYPALAGKPLEENDPSLQVVTDSFHRPIWVVFKRL